MNRVSVCPGCGLKLPNRNLAPYEHYDASGECWELKGELTAYNMMSGDPTFIHQYCVDAYGAQHSGRKTKPITTAYALVGLCLTVEYGFTGKQVQLAHMKLGKPTSQWPLLMPPHHTGDLNVLDVLNAEPGIRRNDMIKAWAESVWSSWESQHEAIRTLCAPFIK